MNKKQFELNPIEDDFDMRETWGILLKRKLIVLVATVITTIFAIVYTWVVVPVYTGNVLIEIGDVIINGDVTNDKPTIIQPIENVNDLREVLQQVLVLEDKIILSGSAKIIKISCNSSDKNNIRKNLQDATNFVLKRHKEKRLLFQNIKAEVSPTYVVSKINISADPIKPNKMLTIVVALIGGLLLGIFLAFLREYITSNRIDDKVGLE